MEAHFVQMEFLVFRDVDGDMELYVVEMEVDMGMALLMSTTTWTRPLSTWCRHGNGPLHVDNDIDNAFVHMVSICASHHMDDDMDNMSSTWTSMWGGLFSHR